MVEITKTHTVHGGKLHYCTHHSAATSTPMRFSLFVPPGTGPFPYMIWLSGLTCTEDNFTTKAGAYQAASEHGLAVLAPDTSPRGEGVADDPAYDLGQGAGFYVDATQAPWAAHFQMETYVTRDLIAAEGTFPLDGSRRGISGHSMGGHGALTLAFRHPGLFKSLSAFAPICAPTTVPWGEKAFAAYLGSDQSLWAQHDAAAPMAAGASASFADILIDQGADDPFLATQLRPQALEEAAAAAGCKISLRLHTGYDHSYFFITSFIADHIKWHRQRL